MIKFIKNLFLLEKKPSKGLLAAEWIMLAYMLFTIVFMALNYSKLTHPGEMIWGRGCILVITAVLWGLYRILPCRLTRFLRIAVQLAFLGWWYPDTYELNRVLPNLDHVFAQWEQSIFGLQPALVFHQTFSSPVFSEMMDMGYASYYPMILLVTLFYFLFRYNEFEKAAFVILTSFFIFYVIFVLVPVTGPTFYFKAVGIDNIVNGVFPNVNDYFNTHQECLPSPGHHDGLFYKMVEGAKQAGSSYGGILEFRRGIQAASCVGPGKSNQRSAQMRRTRHRLRICDDDSCEICPRRQIPPASVWRATIHPLRLHALHR